MTGALSGLQVVEVGGFETLYAGKLMADQGANVVLVEPPTGHPSRRLPPHAPGPITDTSGVPFTYLNGNKQSAAIDLDTAVGRRELGALVASADVVLAGGRPSQIRQWGLDADSTVSGPLLVAITPFGWTGPWAEYHADELVLTALGGMASLVGYADDRPLQLPAGVAYAAAGLFAAVGTAAWLIDTSHPGFIDVSIHESLVMGLENAAQFHELEGVVRRRTGGLDSQVGRGVYACRDGHVYLMLGLSAGSAFWHRFLSWLDDWEVPGRKALAGPEWTERTHIESSAAKASFREHVRELFEHHTKDELYREARKRGIPLAPVNTVADVLVSEQFVAREAFVEIDTSDWLHGPGKAPGAPYRTSRTTWCGRYAPQPIGHGRVSPAEARSAPAGSARRAPDALPLAGVRVIDFSWVGAGSYTTRILGDLGADVVKVESTTRIDQIRLSPPFRDGILGVNRSGYFADRNASKRSITVNLKDPAGLNLVHGLIRSADIVANNFSPGTMDRLGLGYQALVAIRPDVIYLTMSMQGQDGPDAHHVGYGLTIAAIAGLHALVGDGDREPIGTGTNYPDHIPSPGHAAFAVLCALRERRRTGHGQVIELSQAEVTMAMIGPEILAQSAGIDRHAQANHDPTALLHDTFRTRGDDAWIAISIRSHDEWHRLLAALDLPSAPPPAPAAVRDVDANRQLRQWVEDRTHALQGRDLMTALQAAGIRAGIVQTAREVVDHDEQLHHRHHWVRIPHQEAGEFLYNCLPFRFPDMDIAPVTGAPLLGGDTDDVLREAGLDDAAIAALTRDGTLT